MIPGRGSGQLAAALLEPFMAARNRSAGVHPARKGFPLAGARCVEPLGRGTTTTFASLLTDHRTIGETEPIPCNHERLQLPSFYAVFRNSRCVTWRYLLVPEETSE
jgi:hypothetical protein